MQRETGLLHASRAAGLVARAAPAWRSTLEFRPLGALGTSLASIPAAESPAFPGGRTPAASSAHLTECLSELGQRHRSVPVRIHPFQVAAHSIRDLFAAELAVAIGIAALKDPGRIETATAPAPAFESTRAGRRLRS